MYVVNPTGFRLRLFFSVTTNRRGAGGGGGAGGGLNAESPRLGSDPNANCNECLP